MGKLTMNAGLFAFKANQSGVQADNFIALNFRYPQGVTAEGLEIGIENRWHGRRNSDSERAQHGASLCAD